VRAATRHVVEQFGLSPAAMDRREERKYQLKTIWHDMIRCGEC